MRAPELGTATLKRVREAIESNGKLQHLLGGWCAESAPGPNGLGVFFCFGKVLHASEPRPTDAPTDTRQPAHASRGFRATTPGMDAGKYAGKTR